VKNKIVQMAQKFRTKDDVGDCYLEKEMNKYLDMPVNYDIHVFEFWKENENKLPILAALAKNFLVIPATSAKAKRNFSVAGDIDTAERCNLLPAKFCAQMFIKFGNP
jgi:hypothetical protein